MKAKVKTASETYADYEIAYGEKGDRRAHALRGSGRGESVPCFFLADKVSLVRLLSFYYFLVKSVLI